MVIILSKKICQLLKNYPMLVSLVLIVFLVTTGLVTWYNFQSHQWIAAGNLRSNTSLSHIKTAGLVYLDPTKSQRKWISTQENLGVFSGSTQQSIGDMENTNLIYENYSGVTINSLEFRSLLNTSNTMKINLEKAFLHYSADVKIPLTGRDISVTRTRKHTILENHFEKILTKPINGYGDYQDITPQIEQVAGTTGSYPIQICGKQNAIYLGLSGKFAQININIRTGESATLILSQSTGSDNDWADVAIQDSTNGLIQSGIIQFIPNKNWSQRSINGFYLYWVRLHCSNSTGVTLKTDVVENAKYVWDGTPGFMTKAYATDTDSYLVPGWDERNDQDGDGYVSDGEFEHLVNRNATARSLREARVPSYYYRGQFVANLSNNLFLENVKQMLSTDLNRTNADGIFLDNTNLFVQDTFKGNSSYVEVGSQDSQANSMRSFVSQLKFWYGSKLLYANFGIAGAKDANLQVDGGMIENAIGIKAEFKDSPNEIAKLNQVFNQAASKRKYIIVNSNPDQRFLIEKGVTKERSNMYTLARYYLTSNNFTLFNYQDSSQYGRPWVDWFDAIKFNVGVANGPWKIAAAGQVPTPSASLPNLLNNPTFANPQIGGLPSDWICSSIKGRVSCAASQSSLRLTGSQGNTTDKGYGGAYQNLRLEPNTRYTMTAKIKTSGLVTNSSSAIRFAANCTPKCVHYGWDGSGTGTDWKSIYSIFQTGDDGKITVWLMLSEANGVAYFKDLKLIKGEYPYTYLYSRDFSKATVYLRPELEKLDINNGDETVATFNLPRTYIGKLENNGAVSYGSLQTLNMRSLEGAILIK